MARGNLGFAELALIWRLITRQDLHQRLIPAAYWDQLALRLRTTINLARAVC